MELSHHKCLTDRHYRIIMSQNNSLHSVWEEKMLFIGSSALTRKKWRKYFNTFNLNMIMYTDLPTPQLLPGNSVLKIQSDCFDIWLYKFDFELVWLLLICEWLQYTCKTKFSLSQTFMKAEKFRRKKSIKRKY